jgi:prepilin-type N-terminal cleavage/methylation domain-containing protein
MKRLRRRQSKGFTLVELMVVLALLSFLAALVFSVVGSARERGRQTTCVAQLRQIGAAYSMYAQDFEGRPPQLETLNAGYLKLPSLLMCPSDPWRQLDGDAGTNRSQYLSVAPDYCLPATLPVTYYYSGNNCNTPEEANSYWEQLEKGMGPSTGIVACRVHGERSNTWYPDRVLSTAYQGRVLRLQLDGAVVTRQYSIKQAGSTEFVDAWDWFSDKPHTTEEP